MFPLKIVHLIACPFGLRRFPVWRGCSNLGNDADIGGAHTILLSSISGCVVAVIVYKVGTSQLLKVAFGIKGLAIFPFCGDMMTIGVGAN